LDVFAVVVVVAVSRFLLGLLLLLSLALFP